MASSATNTSHIFSEPYTNRPQPVVPVAETTLVITGAIEAVKLTSVAGTPGFKDPVGMGNLWQQAGDTG